MVSRTWGRALGTAATVAAAAWLAAGAFAAVPAPAASARPATFTLGRSGGSIRPITVTIAASGKVTAATGSPVTPRVAVVPPATLSRLTALVASTGFFALPTRITCPATLPDLASRVVTVRQGGRTRTVTERGGCNAPFESLVAALSAAAGVS